MNPTFDSSFCIACTWIFTVSFDQIGDLKEKRILADAGAVELTKDNQAMISALRKISQDSVVTLENNGMAAMFIANPLEKVTSLFQTHPSIEERISALKNY